MYILSIYPFLNFLLHLFFKIVTVFLFVTDKVLPHILLHPDIVIGPVIAFIVALTSSDIKDRMSVSGAC